MDLIPVELWIQIVRNLHKRDRVVLSTTCRLLATIVQPILYEELDIRPSWNECGAQLMTFFLPTSGAGDQPLACRVRSLEMYATRSPSTTVPDQLASFSNLQKLHLRNFHLTSHGQAIIHTLTRLSSLKLSSCTTDSTLSELPLCSPGSNISELIIEAPQSAKGWATFAPPGLQTLVIGFVEPWSSILSNFISQGINESLTKLVWNYTLIPAEIFRLLELCPNICYLSLDCSANEANEVPTLLTIKSSSVPRLVHFTGPAEYADIFVRGRPVCSVALRLEYETPFHAISALRFSSVPVTKVAIYAELYEVNVESVLQYVPATVHYLRWQQRQGAVELEPWNAALSRMTALRVLELDLLSFGLLQSMRVIFYPKTRPKQAMQGLSKACPSLREAIFVDFQRRYRWRNDGSWEEYQYFPF